MIARIWQGVVTGSKSDEYFKYIKKTGIPGLKNTEGNKGVYVLRRNEENRTHFLMMSLWDGVESIRKFTGEEIEKARYYPEDEKFLLELDPYVKHFEVLEPAQK